MQYRVCGYDTYDAVSGYATTDERIVINNALPVIETEQAEDAGLLADGLTFAYTVTDADEGTLLTVREYVDGALTRELSEQESGTEFTFDLTGEAWMRVLNGTHIIRIEADDGEAVTAFEVAFQKMITSAVVTLKHGLPADAPIEAAALSITGSIPADAELKVEITNNYSDDDPDSVVWEDCTAVVREGHNHVFTNTTTGPGCLNFRIHVEAGASGAGGYITGVQGGFQ